MGFPMAAWRQSWGEEILGSKSRGCSTTPCLAGGVGGREPCFLLCKRVEKKIESFLRFFLSARHGGVESTQFIKPKGRRPASILAGSTVYFRRLAASRHRSFPCSAHSCLDFTRVHITVYQRGCIFFFVCVLHFAEYKLNSSRKNKCRFCSAMQRYRGWERGRGDTCLPLGPESLAGGGIFGAQVWSWKAPCGISTPEGRRSRRGFPHPSPGSIQLIRRYRDIWPSKRSDLFAVQFSAGLIPT